MLNLGTRQETNGQLRALPALPARIKPPVPTKQEACWVPDQVLEFSDQNLLSMSGTEPQIIPLTA